MTGMGYAFQNKKPKHLPTRLRARGANIPPHRPTPTTISPRYSRAQRVWQSSRLAQAGSLSQDPLGFEDGGNLFAYVRESPATYDDPSGLACNGLPDGLTVVRNRGEFSNVWLREYVPKEPFLGLYRAVTPRIGSSMTMWWEPDSAAFVDEDGCCCCDKIGFIQVGASKAKYIGRPRFLPLPKKWFVDGPDPLKYKHSTTSDPCNNELFARRKIELTDSPNAPNAWKGIGSRLRSLSQQFITCVVCLEGNEGINFEHEILWPGIYKHHIKGITVYGCIHWGHQIKWSGKANKYIYKRFADGVWDPVEVDLKHRQGSDPDHNWWLTVRDFTFTGGRN